MDSNGFTGLNPALARQNIIDFTEKGIDAAEEYNKAIKFLFEQLYYAWCSPKAVEFCDLYETEIYGSYKKIYLNICDICFNALRAYNIVASANNERTIDYQPREFSYSQNYTKLLDNKDGTVGMNVNLVKNYILPEFDNKVRNSLSLIDNLPHSIALYDDENGQQHSFFTGISKLVAEANDVITSIEKVINKCLAEEHDTIKLAKEQATQTLNG